MMKTIAVLCSLALCAPVGALEYRDNTITLNSDEAQICSAGGGCIVATKAAIVDAMRKVHAAALASCGKPA